VAVFDWLVNVQPRIKEPTLVEQAVLERTERSAMTDWLTGLYNRGAFRASALRELRRAQRYRQRLSLLLFDLDDFKIVNDRYGHERGDLVLRETSRLVGKLVRDVDVAGRYGGEEFAVLLPETGREGAASVAERIRCAVAQQSWERGPLDEPIRMTISGGIAVYPEDGGELNDLFRQADAALYRAKATGKDRIVWEYMERRQSRRHPLAGIRVSVQVRKAHESRVLPATAREMSRTGLGLTVLERFEIGEKIELALEGIGPDGPLALLGRVVHHVERQGDDGVPAFDLGVGLDEGSYPAAAAAIETIFSGGSAGAEPIDRSPSH
jgi:diguanylate cyclase (GGDEF)-like protein